MKIQIFDQVCSGVTAHKNSIRMQQCEVHLALSIQESNICLLYFQTKFLLRLFMELLRFR